MTDRVECPECEAERLETGRICPNAGDGRCPGLLDASSNRAADYSDAIDETTAEGYDMEHEAEPIGNEPVRCPQCQHESPWFYTRCGLCGCPLHAIPNRAAELSDLEREGLDLVAQHFGWEKPNPDATRNRVPTEDELAEVMASCWDSPGFTSSRDANGYPKMAKALRAYLLERFDA